MGEQLGFGEMRANSHGKNSFKNLTKSRKKSDGLVG